MIVKIKFVMEVMMPRSEFIYLPRGGGFESWIEVQTNGIIVLHSENDGYAVGRRGFEASERQIDLAEVGRLTRHDPEVVARVRAALARLAPKPTATPDIVLVRSPAPTEIELVIGEGGRCRVLQLSFAQARLLLVQLANVVCA
jgi:hypothetical protein